MAVELTPSGTRGANVPRLTFLKWLEPLIYRLFGKRFFTGTPLLRLTTVGARSGEERVTNLGAFVLGENQWLVVASNAGAAKHPGWYVNLAENPDKVWVEFDGRKVRVRPESLKGPEREEAWREVVVARAPSYAGYETKTDREISLVRLTAV